MHLQGNENILRVFHHHPLPFVFRAIKIITASLPFYFIIFLFSSLFKPEIQILLYGGVTFLFLLICIYDLMIFYLDRLIITNRRVIHIDWVNLFTNHEVEALLDDIQDIQTTENGFLAKLKIFDYGHFELETSSTKTTIIFPEANDPEGIKHFIYNASKLHFNLYHSHKSGNADQAIEKEDKKVESKSIL